jgi:hypothetical protein
LAAAFLREMKKRFGVLAAAFGTAVVAAVVMVSTRQAEAAFGGGISQPPLGKVCTIQFRRGDALGGAGNLPVPPTTDSINGSATSISGKLRSVSDEWIVVEAANQSMIWVPKTAVLLVMAPNQ